MPNEMYPLFLFLFLPKPVPSMPQIINRRASLAPRIPTINHWPLPTGRRSARSTNSVTAPVHPRTPHPWGVQDPMPLVRALPGGMLRGEKVTGWRSRACAGQGTHRAAGWGAVPPLGSSSGPVVPLPGIGLGKGARGGCAPLEAWGVTGETGAADNHPTE